MSGGLARNLMRGVVRVAPGDELSLSSLLSRVWRVERRVAAAGFGGVEGRLGEADRRRLRVLDLASCGGAFSADDLVIGGLGVMFLLEDVGRFEAVVEGVEWVAVLPLPMADAYLFFGGLACWP